MNVREMDRHAPAVKRELVVLDLCVIAIFLIGLLIVLYRSAVLPERFMGDENVIRQLALEIRSADGDSSYGTVAAIYKYVGLANSQLAAGVVGYLIACVPYLMILSKYRQFGANLGAVFVLAIGVLLGAVYLGTYSKEVFVVPVVVALMLCRPRAGGTLVICALMALYAANFRSYWFLMLVIFLFVFFVLKRTQAVWLIIAISLIAVLAASFVFSWVMGVPADYFRESVNVYRMSSGTVNTLIPSYIQTGSSFDGPINNTISFITLQFPLPLLMKLSPYYIGLGLVLGILWGGFYSRISSMFKTVDKNHHDRLLRIFAFVLAFSITQAFFEPDYGSSLKHLTPLLPLFMLAFLVVRNRPMDPTEKEPCKIGQY